MSLQAQTTIVDELQSNDPGSKGMVRITCDPAINRLLGSPLGVVSVGGEVKFLKMPGYRVQAFSGNDPRRSREEALSKQKRIKEFYPQIATYVTYRSPKWSLRVGDFRTREEAILCLQELKRDFPDFGKEMYTVKEEEVNIPIYNSYE